MVNGQTLNRSPAGAAGATAADTDERPGSGERTRGTGGRAPVRPTRKRAYDELSHYRQSSYLPSVRPSVRPPPSLQVISVVCGRARIGNLLLLLVFSQSSVGRRSLGEDVVKKKGSSVRPPGPPSDHRQQMGSGEASKSLYSGMKTLTAGSGPTTKFSLPPLPQEYRNSQHDLEVNSAED